MPQRNQKILLSDQEAIISLCTPLGSGAIALLRLCGDNAVDVASDISKLSSGKTLNDFPTHTIHHGYVVGDDASDSPVRPELVEGYERFQSQPRSYGSTGSPRTDRVIDEVLFFLMHGPKTFTGQDTVEISCHNNPFIIEQIIELAIKAGARLAGRGEFTKRAFLNNKVDLIQAESINELINAQTELALRKSMAQLQGSLSSCMHEIESELVGFLSLVEGSFEFFEEEQQDLEIDQMIKEKMFGVIDHLKEIKVNFNQQQQIKNGINVSLIGWVNAGKSTLFNSLLKKDRAIVTNIEGTTRDSVECSMYKNGNFWLLVDTAGLRQTQDFIEQEGIERSKKQAAISDIILLVFDLSKVLSEQQIKIYKEIIEKYHNKIIIVANKVDAQNEKAAEQLKSIVDDYSEVIKVSAIEKKGIDVLEEVIEGKIQELFSKLQSPFLLNQRQYNLVVELEQKLEFIVNKYSDKIQYELIAYHLKDMLEKLSELTGRSVSEKVLDRVFSDFCIGK